MILIKNLKLTKLFQLFLGQERKEPHNEGFETLPEAQLLITVRVTLLNPLIPIVCVHDRYEHCVEHINDQQVVDAEIDGLQ